MKLDRMASGKVTLRTPTTLKNRATLNPPSSWLIDMLLDRLLLDNSAIQALKCCLPTHQLSHTNLALT